MNYRRNRSLSHAAKNGPSLTRRDILCTTAGLVVASATSGPLLLVGGRARAAEKLYFAYYGGSYGEALDDVFFKPFARETGVEVVQTPPAALAKLKAAVSTGDVEWDIIDWLQADVQTAANNGLLQPIDYSVIDAGDIIYPLSRQPYSVSMFIYTGGIGYDTRRHPDGKHPTTWAEFWDVKKFPGRRGLRARPQDTLEIALLGAGIEPNKVYPMDVDLAFKSLNEIKPHITRWVETAPQSIIRHHVDTVDGRRLLSIELNRPGHRALEKRTPVVLGWRATDMRVLSEPTKGSR